MRVQIPAYTDRWMQGDRYGAVTKTYRGRFRDPRTGQMHDIVRVLLDKSGKVVRVILDDCTEV